MSVKLKHYKILVTLNLIPSQRQLFHTKNAQVMDIYKIMEIDITSFRMTNSWPTHFAFSLKYVYSECECNMFSLLSWTNLLDVVNISAVVICSTIAECLQCYAGKFEKC
jgi:hypothetical protein